MLGIVVLGVSVIPFVNATRPTIAEFGYNDLVQLIRRHHVQSIENLIPLLPDDLRSNFTLVYHSQSIQGATLEKPRAVLFGSTGKLMLTFNGDSSQRGGNSIEVMEYLNKPAPARFSMREIKFPSKGRRSIEFSRENPEKCTRCHQTDPKPIWKSYLSTDGVYGNMEGENGKRFLDFKKKALQKNSRYKGLIWKSGEKNQPPNPYFPYYPPRGDSYHPQELIRYHPNFRLTTLISVNYARVLADRVSSSPTYSPLRYALVYREVCSASTPTARNFESILRGRNAEANGKGKELSEADILKAFGIREGALSLELTPKGNSATNTGLPGLDNSSLTTLDMTAYRIIMKMESENPGLGQLWKKTHVTFRDFVSRYNPEAFGGASQYGDYLSAEMPLPVKKGALGKFCEYLNEKAEKELDEMARSHCTTRLSKAEPIPQEAQFMRELNSRLAAPSGSPGLEVAHEQGCIDCHSSNGTLGIGPLFDFDDLSKLRDQARELWCKHKGSLVDMIKYRTDKNTSPKFRMPRGEPALSDSDRNALINYVSKAMDLSPCRALHH